jgi:hypothetical protein
MINSYVVGGGEQGDDARNTAALRFLQHKTKSHHIGLLSGRPFLS